MKEAFNNLGYCYRKIGKPDLSLTAFHQALKLDSNYAQALEYMGETYLVLNDIKNADINLLKLTELKSPYADSLSHAIEKYKLRQINKILQKGKK